MSGDAAQYRYDRIHDHDAGVRECWHAMHPESTDVAVRSALFGEYEIRLGTSTALQ